MGEEKQRENKTMKLVNLLCAIAILSVAVGGSGS